VSYRAQAYLPGAQRRHVPPRDAGVDRARRPISTRATSASRTPSASAPGVRILGSAHTGLTDRARSSETDLAVEPVRIERGADIGVNAVVLPGVTIGAGSIVGAGAV